MPKASHCKSLDLPGPLGITQRSHSIKAVLAKAPAVKAYASDYLSGNTCRNQDSTLGGSTALHIKRLRSPPKSAPNFPREAAAKPSVIRSSRDPEQDHQKALQVKDPSERPQGTLQFKSALEDAPRHIHIWTPTRRPQRHLRVRNHGKMSRVPLRHPTRMPLHHPTGASCVASATAPGTVDKNIPRVWPRQRPRGP